MGACGSAPQGQAIHAEKDKEINKVIEDDRKRMDNEVKLLLLGAGESGKTTIAKQMRIIHLQGFSEEDRLSYKSVIFTNIITSIRVLIQATRDLGLTLTGDNQAAAEKLSTGDEYFNVDINAEIAKSIKNLWADPAIQEAFNRSAEFQLNDSAGYYFANIDRISAPNYVPNEQDVLRSRAKTTGIIETEFAVEGVNFRLVDVGGQRSERKKWMHCFQDVTAVIFCVALSEYDLKLYEDDSTNRMMESLRLFREVCNNKWFVDTAMILFLNKKDIFEQKIQKIDLNVCFPNYTGGKDFDAASKFIRDQFVAQNNNPKKDIYPHVTCATSTENMKHVFMAVKETIIKKCFASSDLV